MYLWSEGETVIQQTSLLLYIPKQRKSDFDPIESHCLAGVIFYGSWYISAFFFLLSWFRNMCNNAYFAFFPCQFQYLHYLLIAKIYFVRFLALISSTSGMLTSLNYCDSSLKPYPKNIRFKPYQNVLHASLWHTEHRLHLIV